MQAINGWIRKEAKYLSKVFFAYDSPSFVSRVSGRYAPQTVEVYGERDGGWIQIQTSNGLKWVNEGILIVVKLY